MNVRSIFAAVSAIAAMSVVFLSACGQETTYTADQLNAAKAAAAADAKATEAKAADAKLSAAKSEMKKLGIETARQGGFNSKANCNVMPQGVMGSKSSRDFPEHAASFYKEACVNEVIAMNSERKVNTDRAVARAKAAEQKLAAANKKAGHGHQAPAAKKG